jgi:hypothetical protein
LITSSRGGRTHFCAAFLDLLRMFGMFRGVQVVLVLIVAGLPEALGAFF